MHPFLSALFHLSNQRLLSILFQLLHCCWPNIRGRSRMDHFVISVLLLLLFGLRLLIFTIKIKLSESLAVVLYVSVLRFLPHCFSSRRHDSSSLSPLHRYIALAFSALDLSLLKSVAGINALIPDLRMLSHNLSGGHLSTLDSRTHSMFRVTHTNFI